MISIDNPFPTRKVYCTGCGACFAICPQSAITMKYDNCGHLEPVIDFTKCISCNKCERECPVNNVPQFNAPLQVLAASSLNQDALSTSSSGGIFSVLADYVLKNNGVVYGVAMNFDSNGQVKVTHKRVSSCKNIQCLYGSKYTESEASTVYRQIKEDLKQGIQVLFVGTPCQVAAVIRITKNPSNLYTVDLVCHGVAPQKMFQDYVKDLSEKKHVKLSSFRFRSKILGWSLTGELEGVKVNGRKIKKVVPCTSSSYYSLFLSGFIFRDSCYSCRYAQRMRISDITLGDFWGVNRYSHLVTSLIAQGVQLSEGVSCVLVNTQKGKEILGDNNFRCCECTFEEAAKENSQLKHPSSQPLETDIIKRKYQEGGYREVADFINSKIPLRSKIIAFVKCNLPLQLLKYMLNKNI